MFGVIFRRYTFAGMKGTLGENNEEMELKTTSFYEICKYVLADHNSQISPSLHCKISSEEPSSRTHLREDLRVHTSRTPLADSTQKALLHHPARQHQQNQIARTFCETLLAVTTRKSPSDWRARQHCEYILAARPSSLARHFSAESFCEIVLAVQPNMKKCDITLREPTRRLWSQIVGLWILRDTSSRPT